MNVQENEPKPYGTRNEAGSQFTERKDIKVEPYATQNVTPTYGGSEVYPAGQTRVETTTKQQTYPQQQQETRQTRVQRGWSQYDTDQLKNPVVATILGLSLALFLMSLTHFLPSMHMPHMPRMFSSSHQDRSLVDKDNYDYQRYGARDNDYWRDRNYQEKEYRPRSQWREEEHHPESRWRLFGRGRHEEHEEHPSQSGWRWFGRGRHEEHEEHPSQSGWRWFGRGRHEEHEEHPSQSGWRWFGRKQPEMRQQAQEMAYDYARDKASGMYQNAKDTAGSFYEKARDAIPGMGYMTSSGGSGGNYPSVGTFKDEAQRQACQTAERVRDYACGYDSGSSRGGSSYFPSGQRMMEDARYAGHKVADNARYAQEQMQESSESIQRRASDLYEAARQRANDVLQTAKDTVTYPVNAAKDAAMNTAQAAKETVLKTGDIAKDTTSTVTDTVSGATQAVKDTVTGATQAVKDTVTGVYETVKEHTPGFGSGSTEEANCVGDNCHLKSSKAQIKVEVREV